MATGQQDSGASEGTAALLADLERARRQGKRIVHCHGVFDLLHPGHLDHLVEARAQGDVLVVTLTPDRYVNKGPGRPVFSADQRLRMLAALEVVDFVAVTDSPTSVSAIREIRPDVYVKGPDYVDEQADISGNIRLEREAVESAGGRIHFTQAPTMSSSHLINSHFRRHGRATTQWLQDFRSRHSEVELLSWVARVAQLKVLVVGEAIIDEYVRCEALGKSSKDPVLAFRELSTERHTGGSLAIARHCAGLGADITTLFRIGNDPRDETFIAENMPSNMRTVIARSQVEPTIVKRRFVDDHTEARVFETYIMNDGIPAPADDETFRALLNQQLDLVDLVVVADYGHGLLTEGAIHDLTVSGRTLAINTQSNAGNRGFNTISKYARSDYVCLNGGEVGLELRQRHLTLNELVPQLRERTGAARVIVTEGAFGLACCDADREVVHVPAFAESVRDRVGAGDALFSVTSLLTAVGAPPDVTGFFGNLAGAASVAELGNRRSISAADLARHATALLK